jgi:hypothetical protein
MAKSKLVEVNKKIEEKVVSRYKKIENGVVGSFQKMTDKFVDSYLTKDGESVEEAKVRLQTEQTVRENTAIKEREERRQKQQERMEEINKKGRV